MSYAVEWASDAIRDLQRIEPIEVAEAVLDHIEEVLQNPGELGRRSPFDQIPGQMSLVELEDGERTRHFAVLFQYSQDETVIYIVRIMEAFG